MGTGFRKRSRSNNKVEQDDGSKKSHPALARQAEQKVEVDAKDIRGALALYRSADAILVAFVAALAALFIALG